MQNNLSNVSENISIATDTDLMSLFRKYTSFDELYFSIYYQDIPDFTFENYLEYRKECNYMNLIVKKFSICTQDYTGKHIQTKNGMYVTAYKHEKFLHRIHFFGPSYLTCATVPTKYTLTSCFQRLCNEIFSDYFLVVNHGIGKCYIHNAWLKLRYSLDNFDISPGDCVLLFDNTNAYMFKDHYLEIARYCQQRQYYFKVFSWPIIKQITMHSPLEKKLEQYSLSELWKSAVNNFELPVPKSRYLPSGYARARNNKHFSLFPWFYDLQPDIGRPHGYGEIVIDHRCHLSYNGNRLIADAVFRTLAEYLCSPSEAIAIQSSVGEYLPETTLSNYSTVQLEKKFDVISIQWLQKELQQILNKNKNIQHWLESVQRFPDNMKKIGAIVMNCNPMTMGHVHCIEQALLHVDALYIFVVQDDKSYFPFKQRFAVVKEACKRGFADKVCVVPSGNFIISSFSFPGYFTKEKQQLSADDRDSSFDVTIFGAAIAPALRVTSRFVGDEPFCPVTREYNEAMLRFLPPMGVSVHVFPRLQAGDIPISASRVRALFQAGDMDAIRKLVPAVTYRYLTRLHDKRQMEAQTQVLDQ